MVGKIVLKGCVLVFFFLFFSLCFGTQICFNPLVVDGDDMYSSFLFYVYDYDYKREKPKKKKRIDEFVIVFCDAIILRLLFSTGYE